MPLPSRPMPPIPFPLRMRSFPAPAAAASTSRTARIALLRAQIAAGTYRIASAELADCLMARMRAAGR